MFQTYDVRGGADQGRKALPLIRAQLAQLGLDGLFVPHEDEWQNEYLPDCTERLAWATGFTGSAGAAIILKDKAYLFSDGRYTQQALSQTAPELFEQRDLVDQGPAVWLKAEAPAGAKIGYDPRLVPPDVLARLKESATQAGVELVALDANPIDQAWTDRPAEPTAEIVPHPETFSGESSASKRSRIGEKLARDGLDISVLTAPAALAWLFNIRGKDVTRTPLALGSALLSQDGTAQLFVKPEKVTPDLRGFLGNEVSIRAESEFVDALRETSGKRVLVDPSLSSAHVFDVLHGAGAQVVRGQDPTIVPRALKNPVEIAGAKRAHARDGVALANFLCWFDREAPKGKLTEIDICKAIEGFRIATGALQDLSFDSISGAGPNGAFPHYRVTVESNRPVDQDSLFLLDSGGQYLDGTTDVTRTIAVGNPSPEMKDRFTRVLKGHIALSRVRFPKGTTGSALDILARLSLWEAGFDYDHGTGHGVGSYLGVHEGPHRIAKVPNQVAMEPGMIVSNEPGYYKIDGYGIRTENLQFVTPASPIPGGERPMLGFETLTLAPIDRRLILPDLLSPAERDWLNAYHARVLAEIGPRVEGDVRIWLEAATAPI
ncbi:putative dipeptidase PepE [Candidatus Phycosocius bacilliformis]|uniref:Putative dipeptidase PepE n=1 Tax=Candidatus Phycosocius bacilliformis TaxID=1445552 RepID=A0A2P2E972_9PROT|nr:aminopeptidase P family protein [Candidatus Phycosocius bacilliformis]GBF57612.1 putative dipeptidase PepE [Candidatus Phycosocius bacilliformis]